MDQNPSLDDLNHININEIRRSTRRVPYTNGEVQMLVDFIKKNRAKGLMTGMHPFMGGEPQAYIDDGILGVCLEDADADILYVKLEAGTGLFGGQKSNYSFFVGSIHEEALMPGGTHKSWALAITAMNNIYRSIGLL